MVRFGRINESDLRLLRYFCTIVEEGSFTAAQSTLNISQPVLSEAIKSLEIRLGLKLCQRGPKGFKLYPEGAETYQAAKQLFRSLDSFNQRVSTLTNTVGGELSIGIQDGIIDNPKSRITDAIELFYKIEPHIKLTIEVMLGFRMVGRVADGLINFGIGLVDQRLQQLNWHRLFEESISIYCGSQHPLFPIPDDNITQGDIESCRYCHRGQLESARAERAVLALPVEGDVGLGTHAQLALVLSGINIGYIPDHIAKPWVAAERLRVLRPDLTHRNNQIGVAWGPNGIGFSLARKFLDVLVSVHANSRA